MSLDEQFMLEAIKEAKAAFHIGEVPVGCVIVYEDNKIIARSHNIVEQSKNPLMHAEMCAIGSACLYLGDWRLNDCCLYSTLEPCHMCFSAIKLSRIKRIVWGARNIRMGHMSTAGSSVNSKHDKIFVKADILSEISSEMMRSFFRKQRTN